MAMNGNQLRRAFEEFFVDRGHTVVPSSGLIPHHPTAPLFTNAGMIQFVPYFLGEERPPWKRTMTVQKCVRLSGKHNDVDELGKTRRHLSFFEMLGNWSFGDYFKEGAIVLAWELLTEVIGFDGDRLWATGHVTDDDAEAIWHERIGVPMERIQRLGDKENFWEMGDTGPCGPCSEIHFDCGPEWGDPGGPAHGGSDRYVGFWTLVFMDRFPTPDGSLTELPEKNVATGGGLERWQMLLEGVPTVFDTDLLRPLVAEGESLSGKRYLVDDRTDVYLRVLADHARTMTFLVNDGVPPSNEDRGYVVRSVIRRAARRAYQLGLQRAILPHMVETVIDLMGEAYPELRKNRTGIVDIVGREEERFLQTLRSGSVLLDEALDTGTVTGATAFKLHDTFGFPFELTQEIAAERGVPVDRSGFEAAMSEQRRRAKQSRRAVTLTSGDEAGYRALVSEHGTTEFTGYSEYESKGRVLAVVEVPPDGGDGDPRVEIFLDRTPFYAQGGGQVGDTGCITTETGQAEVVDTTAALPGLYRHLAVIVDGEILPGQEATAKIDVERREAIRRNHTGTHLLHWGVREVLGTHVKQQGSLVAPDRLRFDFSHYQPVTREELDQVEALVNARVLANEPVRAYETSKDEAEKTGAIAFFGDKYGDVVRVVEAGTRSTELCGGTHVGALGMIGPIKIVSEGSIAANMRRIEALTGEGSLEHFRADEDLLERTAAALRVRPDELPDRIERLLEERRHLDDELKVLRRAAAGDAAQDLAGEAVDGVVVARRDGTTRDELKDLAVAVRDRAEIRAVVLGGVPEGGGVALVAAVTKDSGFDAPALIAEAARTVGGGGGGKKSDIAVAGGRDASKLDEALDQVRRAAGLAQ